MDLPRVNFGLFIWVPWQAPSGLPRASPAAIRPARLSVTGQRLPCPRQALRTSQVRRCPLPVLTQSAYSRPPPCVCGADAPLEPRLIPLRQLWDFSDHPQSIVAPPHPALIHPRQLFS